MATPTDSNDEITSRRKTVTPTRTHIGRDINSNDEPYTGRKEAEDSNDDATPRATTPTNCKKEELEKKL
ncbi:28225_t:CDS:2, partial [Gigaspora margarita]